MHILTQQNALFEPDMVVFQVIVNKVTDRFALLVALDYVLQVFSTSLVAPDQLVLVNNNILLHFLAQYRLVPAFFSEHSAVSLHQVFVGNWLLANLSQALILAGLLILLADFLVLSNELFILVSHVIANAIIVKRA